MIWFSTLSKVFLEIRILLKNMDRTSPVYNISLVAQNPTFDISGDMGNSFSSEIKDADEYTTGSNGDCRNKRVATSSLEQDSNECFIKAGTSMTFQLMGEHNQKKNQQFLLPMLKSIFRTQNLTQNCS